MDEIGQSSIGINHFIETLQNIMSNIISNSNVLDGVVGNVASSVAASSDMPMIFPRSWKSFLQRWRRYPQRRTASARIRPPRKAKYRRWQIRPRLCHICAGYEEACDGAEHTATENMNSTNEMIGEITTEMNQALENSKSVEKVAQLTADILSTPARQTCLR